MSRTQIAPLFLAGSAGRIFLLLRSPPQAEGCVLFVPPFAEEMNKCRRQFSVTAELLAERGYAALFVDLYGTGDSEGDFADGTWDVWKADIRSAVEWLIGKGHVLHGLIATRIGCALAASALQAGDWKPKRTVFWQPVANGLQFMKQFLRLRVMASMMEEDTRETVEELRRRFESGETLEVAGYPLAPGLWKAIEEIRLTELVGPGLGTLAIHEIGRANADLTPATREVADAARSRGVEVTAVRLPGDPFWAATETTVNESMARLAVEFIAVGERREG